MAVEDILALAINVRIMNYSKKERTKSTGFSYLSIVGRHMVSFSILIISTYYCCPPLNVIWKNF